MIQITIPLVPKFSCYWCLVWPQCMVEMIPRVYVFLTPSPLTFSPTHSSFSKNIIKSTMSSSTPLCLYSENQGLLMLPSLSPITSQQCWVFCWPWGGGAATHLLKWHLEAKDDMMFMKIYLVELISSNYEIMNLEFEIFIISSLHSTTRFWRILNYII